MGEIKSTVELMAEDTLKFNILSYQLEELLSEGMTHEEAHKQITETNRKNKNKS